jgi:hypothetical protein
VIGYALWNCLGATSQGVADHQHASEAITIYIITRPISTTPKINKATPVTLRTQVK